MLPCKSNNQPDMQSLQRSIYQASELLPVIVNVCLSGILE